MLKSFYRWTIVGGGLTAGAVAVLLIFCGMILAIPHSSSQIFENAKAIISPHESENHKLNQIDYKNLKALTDKGALLSLNDILADTMNYYSNIITVLVSIIGIMGVIAFMYVRGVSKESAIREARDYFESRDFTSRIAEHVEKSIKDSDEWGEIQEKIQNLSAIEVKVNDLDETIESLRNGSSASNDEELELPRENQDNEESPPKKEGKS